MAIQDSFQIDHNQAYNGMVVDGQIHNVVSRLNTDAETIAYGTPVWDNATNTGGTAKSATGLFVGIARREVANRNYMEGTIAGFEAGRTMSVVNVGVVWIDTQGLPVASGDEVAYDITTGKFVATGGSGETLEGCTWLTAPDLNGFAKLKIQLGA